MVSSNCSQITQTKSLQILDGSHLLKRWALMLNETHSMIFERFFKKEINYV